MSPKIWYLICYDIRDPKRWRNVYKRLEGYGERLQYSIFHCRLTAREREELRCELEKYLAEEDDLLIIGLCHHCVERISYCNRPNVWSLPEHNFRIF